MVQKIWLYIILFIVYLITLNDLIIRINLKLFELSGIYELNDYNKQLITLLYLMKEKRNTFFLISIV